MATLDWPTIKYRNEREQESDRLNHSKGKKGSTKRIAAPKYRAEPSRDNLRTNQLKITPSDLVPTRTDDEKETRERKRENSQ